MNKIKFTIITLFPEALQPYLDSSMLCKAQKRQILDVKLVNLRDFGIGPHKSVDDTPYGGGDGMLLRCEPVFAAIEAVKRESQAAEVILPTPVGLTWNQALARQFAGIDSSFLDINELASTSVAYKHKENASEPAQNARGDAYGDEVGMDGSSKLQATPEASRLAKGAEKSDSLSNFEGFSPNGYYMASEIKDTHRDGKNDESRHYIILCPHYEGYDERILSIVDHKISLGDYVLTGGELAALVIVDSVTRLLPGVLGGDNSALVESFSAGDNLEYPQYTRPEDFRGMKVPEVLLSGNHAKIAEWRAENSGKKY